MALFFKIMCLYVVFAGVNVDTVAYRRGCDLSGAGVTGGSELPSVGAGNDSSPLQEQCS